MSGRSQSTRDMLRQEAKLHEMTEEVKRREMRSNYPQSQYPVGQARIRVSWNWFSGVQNTQICDINLEHIIYNVA